MRYVDFDGVILDTEDILFYNWRLNPNRKSLTEKDKIEYIKQSNWKQIINEAKEINDALYILKNSSILDYTILTKIHSLENEGYEKIKFLRSKGIKQNIILVPYLLRKTDIVSAKDNILIDDSIKNLIDFELDGGYSMFFNKDDLDYDNFGIKNTKPFQKVRRIDDKKE